MKKKQILCGSLTILVVSIGLLFSAPQEEKKPNLKGFTEFVAKGMAEWKVPGMAISIIKDGKVVFAEGFGFRDIKQSLKVTPRTLFAIGSCTKAFTATAVGILVDEGKVDWDKPVRTYLPAFELQDVVASERMTPRDLLCHRSGLPRHDLMWYGSDFSRNELFDRLRHLEPNKDFRAVWQYQNLMFMTAGYLVGNVAGITWEDFVRKRILEPLDMIDTNFSVNDSQKAADFALPYREKDDQIEPIPFRNIDAIGPAGSINSQVVEMANWVLLNLNKGKFKEKQVISEGALSQIQSPQMVMPGPLQYDEILYPSYGLGWMIVPYRGHLLLQHGGGIDGFTALVAFLPRDQIGAVILTNKSGTPLTSIVLNNILDRLLGFSQVDWSKRLKEQLDKAKAEAEKAKKEADKDRQPDTTPSHPLEDFAGDYEHPAYGTFAIVKDGDALKAKYNTLNFVLKHFHYDIFEAHNEFTDQKIKLAFRTDLRGHIESVSMQLEPAVEEIVFHRAPEKAMMERSFLEKFSGQYEYQGVIVTIALKGDKTLTATVPGQPEYELVPYRGTEFTLKGLQGFSVEFKLDESGNVVEASFIQPNGAVSMKKK